jgi:hypothetical protein
MLNVCFFIFPPQSGANVFMKRIIAFMAQSFFTYMCFKRESAAIHLHTLALPVPDPIYQFVLRDSNGGLLALP